MKNTFKISLAICVILIFGIIIGVVATREFIRYKIEQTFSHGGPPAMGAFMHMAREANLTREQQQQMDEILKDMQPKWHKLFTSHKPEIDALFEESLEKVKTILTDEQKKKLDDALNRMKRGVDNFGPGRRPGPKGEKGDMGRRNLRDPKESVNEIVKNISDEAADKLLLTDDESKFLKEKLKDGFMQFIRQTHKGPPPTPPNGMRPFPGMGPPPVNERLSN